MVAETLEAAERINLKNMERGKFFRIVADVYVDGENFAEALIDSGMAVKYDGGKKILTGVNETGKKFLCQICVNLMGFSRHLLTQYATSVSASLIKIRVNNLSA